MMAVMGILTHQVGRSESCPWQMVAFIRMFSMFLVMLPISRMAGICFPFHASWNLWGRTLGGVSGALCTFFALTHIPVSDATTLFNTAPVWIVMLTWMIYRVVPSWQIGVAIFCCMIGVIIVHQPRFAAANLVEILGVAASALTAFFMAVAFMNLNTLKEVPSLMIVMHFSFWGSVILFIFCLFTCGVTPAAFSENFRIFPDGILLLSVGLTGAVGQIGITKAYKRGVATKISVVGLLQVVYAAGLEMILWSRTFTAREVLGFCMILVPVAVIILKNSRRTAE